MELWCELDAGRIQSVLFNIIGNAVKYSPHGASITVTCGDSGTEAEICVRDEGPGFTAHDKARLFEPGARLSAKPTGGESSTGYGLYSARVSVEIHKGRIWLADEESTERGACFKIRLPKAQSGAKIAPSASI
jgi:signal transduction histidine kinase